MPEFAGAIPIGWWELGLATGFVLLAGALSLVTGLRLERDLAIATVRTYAQLFALGFVLRWVFVNQTWPIVLLLLGVMVVAAARVVIKRAGDAPRGVFGSSVVAMTLTGFTVTFAVTALIVRCRCGTRRATCCRSRGW